MRKWNSINFKIEDLIDSHTFDTIDEVINGHDIEIFLQKLQNGMTANVAATSSDKNGFTSRHDTGTGLKNNKNVKTINKMLIDALIKLLLLFHVTKWVCGFDDKIVIWSRIQIVETKLIYQIKTV